MKALTITVPLIASLAMGCTPTAGAAPEITPAPVVTETRLSDGTRCAYIDQHRAVALDCEWRTNP